MQQPQTDRDLREKINRFEDTIADIVSAPRGLTDEGHEELRLLESEKGFLEAELRRRYENGIKVIASDGRWYPLPGNCAEAPTLPGVDLDIVNGRSVVRNLSGVAVEVRYVR